MGSTARPSSDHDAARRFLRELQAGLQTDDQHAELLSSLRQIELLLRRTYLVFNELCRQQQGLAVEVALLQQQLRRVEGWQRRVTAASPGGAGGEPSAGRH